VKKLSLFFWLGGAADIAESDAGESSSRIIQTRRNTVWEGVIEVTSHILDPDVMRFRYNSIVGIGICDQLIKLQIHNRCGAEKW
jgi:hypothetical protein